MPPQRPSSQTGKHPASGGGSGKQGFAEAYGEECGGRGGVPYEVFADATERIKRVMIWHRQYVDGIQLETESGALPRIGGTGQHRDVHNDCFELDPDEFITGVSVEYWTYVDRITFHTNKRKHGPFGGGEGRLRKDLFAPAGRSVVGFRGRHWTFIDSLQLLVH